MGYVRTMAFSLSREEAARLIPGSDSFNALVGARKYLAQSMPGLVQSYVMQNLNASGRIKFMIVDEWGSLDDLQYYASHPKIVEIENLLHNDVDPIAVSIYEVLG